MTGTFNKSVRDAALIRMSQAGAVMINWFALACELARDWRNDMEGLASLLGGHLPKKGVRNKGVRILKTESAPDPFIPDPFIPRNLGIVLRWPSVVPR
jgi:hypothetical protein